jgi:hypothetical protein
MGKKFFPSWVSNLLIIIGILSLLNLFKGEIVFSISTTGAVLILSCLCFLFRNKIKLDSVQAYYIKNTLIAIAIFMSMVIILNYETITQYFGRKIIEGVEFYTVEDADAFGYQYRFMDISSPKDSRSIFTYRLIEAGIAVFCIVTPFVVWALTRIFFKRQEEKNKEHLSRFTKGLKKIYE